MKIKLENFEIELENLWYLYLYSSLLRFSIAKGISTEWKNDVIVIDKSNKDDFIVMVKNVLSQLISECYKEPSQKEKSKHSSRFQKIIFEENEYIINYRTDVIGKIIFGLNYLMNKLNKAV